MKLFIDTANINEIREISELGVLSGVTTNPSLIAKEGKDLKLVLEEICKLVDGPISGEAVSLNWEDMVKEGVKLSKLHPNIVVKIPMTQDGLIAVKELKKLDIKTNVTLIFTETQALIAAKAGASYVSPFIGRLEDVGEDGISLIKNIRTIFDIHHISTEIIAASIRNKNHVRDVAIAGAHIATIPYKVLKDMMNHPLTDKGIERFVKDWENTFGSKNI